MRMWMVDPKGMCQRHLLGEHVELHMFVGTINKGMSLQGYVDNKLVETWNIVSRHTQLVEEMGRRGMSHQSPLPEFKDPNVGGVDREASLQDLVTRCPACKEGFAKLAANGSS